MLHYIHTCSAPPVCPDGEPEVECLVDPCVDSTCEDVLGAVCVTDRCGACTARWYSGDREVTDSCEGGYIQNVTSLFICRLICTLIIFVMLLIYYVQYS